MEVTFKGWYDGVLDCGLSLTNECDASHHFLIPLKENHSPLVVLSQESLGSRVCKKARTTMIDGVDAQLLFPKCSAGASKASSEVQTLLCTVVETQLVMLFLGCNPSSLCHPCVEAIMKRLADPGNSDFDKHLAENEATLCKLNRQYFDMLEDYCLLDAPIDDLSLQKLEILQKFMAIVHPKNPTSSSFANFAEAINPSVTNPARASSSANVNIH